MNGILFKADIWKAKQRALDKYGEAQTRRLNGLKAINEHPAEWLLVRQDQMVGYPAGVSIFHNRVRTETDGEPVWEKVTPRYRVGEVVYVKEAWCLLAGDDENGDPILYKADPEDANEMDYLKAHGEKVGWDSSRFMPAWAARDFIQIIDVRPDMLRLPLSSKELELEGGDAALKLLRTTEGLWVWVYTFKRIERP